MMKKILFLFGLLVCLAGMPLTAFADNKTAKQTYETAISDNWKTMLKTSSALDTINAENNTHLLEWQDVKNPSDEAVKLVDKIQKLQAEQEEDQESMDPYTKAKKSCDAKLNADGANAALENIIRIQKDRLSDQKELQALWAKVDKLLK